MFSVFFSGLAIVLVTLSTVRAGNYGYGEFVLASRRGQFMGYRTPWMELLGRHCPVFARDRLVVVPIPQPTGFDRVEEYKLSLDFDGGRFITPWLTFLGADAPKVPVLQVTFRYTGDEIRQVRAQIIEASSMLIEQYPHLRSEYSKADHWPKHLLVSYIWEDTREFDVDTGLYLVFTFGIVATLVVGSRVVLQYRAQLAELFDALAASDQEMLAAQQQAHHRAAAAVPPSAFGMPPGMPGAPPIPLPVPGMIGGWGAGPKRD